MRLTLIAFLLLSSYVSFSQNETKPKDELVDIFEAKLNEAIGKPFPEFQGTYDGKPVNNESLKGKTVYINFWFEACDPCIAEFGALNELNQKLADKKDFEFISFTFETPEKIKELKEKYKLNFKIIYIPVRQCQRLNQGFGFPTHFILHKDLTISYLICGGSKDKNEARQFVLGELYQRIVKKLDSMN